MAGGKQEAVALCPGHVAGIIAKFVEVKRCQRVGNAESLADIALPLPARHGEHVAPQVRGPALERTDIGVAGRRISQHDDQSLSSPPDMLSRSAVM